MARPDLPAWSVRLLTTTLPVRTAGAVIGDLTEDFTARAARSGVAHARRWLVRETFSIVGTYLAGRVTGRLSPLALARDLAQPRGAWRDLTQAMRSLGRSPGFTLLASLTLGAGLTTLIVTLGLVDALVVRPISLAHAETLRRIVIIERGGRQSLRVSNVERERIAQAASGIFAIAAASLQPALVRTEERSFQTLAEVVTGNYFSVLGARPVHGRLLAQGDDAAGAPAVAVISDAWWRGLGRPPDILGRSIRVNSAAFTIVGVAPAVGTSSFLGASVDVWVPIAVSDAMMNPGWRTRLDERWFVLLARLEQARDQAAADTALAHARDDLTRAIPDPWRDRRLRTAPPTVLVGSQRAMASRLAALLIGVAFMALAVVCTNVAALFFVRGATGRRAAAIRLSLGAARGAVLRQALCEGVLLSLGAAAFALVFYVAFRRALADVTILPTLSVRLDLPLTPDLVLMTTAAAVCGGVMLAVGPAWWLARVQVGRALRDQSGPISGGASVPRIRRALIAAQMAAALVLAVHAATLSRAMGRLEAIDIGVASDRLLAMDLDLEPLDRAGRGGAVSGALVDDLLHRVRALPGVSSAAMASRAPVDWSTPTVDVVHVGSEAEARLRDVTFYAITPGYFDTVGLPLVRGRTFGDEDVGHDLVIVNETLGRALRTDGDVVGRTIRLEPQGRLARVIGVARDSRYRSLTESSQSHLYLPTKPGFGLALLIRTVGPPGAMATTVQHALDSVGPGVQGFFPRTHRDHLAFDLLPLRTAAGAALAVGIVATGLCLIGLYGLLAWLVQMRRAEIGVRLALGATPRSIVWLVVGQGVRAALPGLIGGAILAVLTTPLAQSALAGVTTSDPSAYIAAILLLAGVVIAASWAAARRAAGVHPSESLRSS
jgi:putative ABC transport system permease protein